MRDISSPGFVVQVLASARDARLGGRPDPGKKPGSILARATDITPQVESFEFIDSDREFGRLRLTVDNFDLSFFDHPAWLPGNLVRFYWGYPGKIQGPRYAVVDSLRGRDRLQISCTEQAALSNASQDRLWKNTTRQLIVAQLVQEGAFPGVTKLAFGSSVPVMARTFIAQAIVGAAAAFTASFFGAPAPEKPRDFQQSAQTDWEFCRRLALDLGCEIFVEDDVLHFHPRLLDRAPIKKYEWYTGVGDFLDWHVEEWRALDRAAEVVVAGRDPISRENLTATGSNTETKRTTLGREGLAAQKTVLRPNGAGDLLLGKHILATPRTDEATVGNMADSYFRGLEQGELDVVASVIGDPVLKKSKLVRLSGISRSLSGNFYIRQVSHRIDKGGYRCELRLIRNAFTALPTTDAPLLAPGVTKTNDGQPTGRKIVATAPGDLTVQGG
jgi:hypothetical protein